MFPKISPCSHFGPHSPPFPFHRLPAEPNTYSGNVLTSSKQIVFQIFVEFGLHHVQILQSDKLSIIQIVQIQIAQKFKWHFFFFNIANNFNLVQKKKKILFYKMVI